MPIRLLKWLLAATVIIFALASGYVSIVAANRQASLQKISRYDVAWTIGQAVSEFMRLEHRLATYALPGSNVPIEEVQLRLDIMFSRLQTFEQTLAPEGPGEQAACLRAVSCTDLQGYLFDRPAPIAELSPGNRPIIAEAKRA